MEKKHKLTILILAILLLLSVVGSILSVTIKPKLYYPFFETESSVYEIFQDNFQTILAMRLYKEGNCSASKGDFVVMHVTHNLYIDADTGNIIDEAYLGSLAEKMAMQGATAVVYETDWAFHGTLYRMNGDEIERISLYEETAEEFSNGLMRYVERSFAVSLCILSAVLFAIFVFVSIWAKTKDAAVQTAVSAANGIPTHNAAEVLSRAKYRISILAAGFLFLCTWAWLTAPNIHMLSEHYFGKGVLIASLVSIPFLAGSLAALVNVTVSRSYRRWINVVNLVVSGVVVVILVFSFLMMLFT